MLSLNGFLSSISVPTVLARTSTVCGLCIFCQYAPDSVSGVDTGIFVNHRAFTGRAKWLATFGDYPDADGNGHGTHTAGTAAGA